MRKFYKALLFFMLVSVSMLSAAPYYDTGSQIFSISAGTNIPLSASSNNNDVWTTNFGPGENGTNFTFGGYGSLDYEVFMNPYFALGGELGYQFNFIGDGNIFSSVPILFKLSYVPIQGSIELPISLGVGLGYLSYDGNSKLTIMSTLTIGVRYFFNEEWGLGLNTGITFIPELYSDDSSKNGLITFVPINLAVSYRH